MNPREVGVYRRTADGQEVEVWHGPTKYEPSPCSRCIAEGRCYVDGRIVTEESNKGLDGCGKPEKRSFVVRTSHNTHCHASEAQLDRLFPDEATFAAEKARALEWTKLQSVPPIDRDIVHGANSTHSAVIALIAEGSLVRVGQRRCYVPLKVTVGGKTFYHEPRSVKEWKAGNNKAERKCWAGSRGSYK